MTRFAVETADLVAGARTLSRDVADPLVASIDRLITTLWDCAAMAGSDPGAVDWARDYDAAAARAIAASQDAINGCFQVSAMLAQTARNYAAAEGASTAGGDGSGSEAGDLAAGSEAALSPPGSAAGGSGDTPDGWDLIAGVVGYVWPNGHQDRLRAAADAWQAAALGVEDVVALIGYVPTSLGRDRLPESDDVAGVCAALTDQVGSLAGVFRGLAHACTELARHIDETHSAVLNELLDLVEWTAGIETASAILAPFTLGASEAAGNGVETWRVVRTATKVGMLISKFVSAARSLAATIPRLSDMAESISLDMQRLLGTRLVTAGVTSVRSLPAARTGVSAVTRTEMAAGEHLAAGASGGRLTRIWKNPRTLRRHFRDHGVDVGATSDLDYAQKAAAFLERARREGLPMKIDYDGTIRVWDPATRTFGSYAHSGAARTFYKTSSPSYWSRQPGVPQ